MLLVLVQFDIKVICVLVFEKKLSVYYGVVYFGEIKLMKEFLIFCKIIFF